MRGRHLGDANRLLEAKDDASNLLRSLTGPGPLASLPGRMVGFAYEYAEIGEQPFKEFGWTQTFGDAVDQYWPGAAAAWAALDVLSSSTAPGH